MTTEKEPLLPCPFCGGKAEILACRNNDRRFRFYYPSCVSDFEKCPGKVEEQDEIGGTNCDCLTRENAAALWNMRKP